ncbi:hypothetical protein [Lactiplantibacillus modestisalitolerans]|uniref:Uncharacterized protein n=1 Tax=Lactiplantibacillus modestisalitolerans TaxID=1457219 RepID=A0ABV5WX04_9LACO
MVTNEDELGMPSGGLTATLAALADSPVSWQQLGKFSGVTRY